MDSHEEWAQNPALIEDIVHGYVHFDLLAASPPLCVPAIASVYPVGRSPSFLSAGEAARQPVGRNVHNRVPYESAMQ